MHAFDTAQRLEILQSAFREVHTVMRESEQLETRMGAAFVAGLLGLAVLIIRGMVGVGESVLVFDLSVIGFSFFAILVLYGNSVRTRSCCRILVRIELGLDLYRSNVFSQRKSFAQSRRAKGMAQGCTQSLRSIGGVDSCRLNSYSYLVGVVFATVIVLSAIYVIA